jgi:hypothetical protein
VTAATHSTRLQRICSRHSVSLAIETFVFRATSCSGSPRNSHSRHLALNGKTLGMAALGVAPHVADKILNHQSGTISGVAAVEVRMAARRRRRMVRSPACGEDQSGAVVEAADGIADDASAI